MGLVDQKENFERKSRKSDWFTYPHENKPMVLNLHCILKYPVTVSMLIDVNYLPLEYLVAL